MFVSIYNYDALSTANKRKDCVVHITSSEQDYVNFVKNKNKNKRIKIK
jgi:hypothetical protein